MKPPSERQNFLFGTMFALQFGALGCWLPVFSLHLQQTLDFNGQQIGMILGMSAASALLSPFLGVVISDRLLSPRTFMGICHGMAALMMLWCATATEYLQVLWGMILYQLVFTPSFALSNAIALRHLEGGRESFGAVRVWGTISWMAVAWLIAGLLKFFPNQSSIALQASAFCSIAMAALCFGLPKKDKPVREEGGLLKVLKLPSGVWKFFLSPSVLMLSGGSFLVSMTYRFYFTGGGPYLVEAGCSMEWVLPALSIGQLLELWCLSRLKGTLNRWGYFGLMGVGAIASLFMFGILAMNPDLVWAIPLMMGHGVTFTYFSTALLMWMDSKVEEKLHSSVHQLMIFIPSLAGVVGGYFSGWMLEPAEASGSYTAFYAVPAIAALVTLFLVIGARQVSSKEPSFPSPS